MNAVLVGKAVENEVQRVAAGRRFRRLVGADDAAPRPGCRSRRRAAKKPRGREDKATLVRQTCFAQRFEVVPEHTEERVLSPCRELRHDEQRGDRRHNQAEASH